MTLHNELISYQQVEKLFILAVAREAEENKDHILAAALRKEGDHDVLLRKAEHYRKKNVKSARVGIAVDDLTVIYDAEDLMDQREEAFIDKNCLIDLTDYHYVGPGNN